MALFTSFSSFIFHSTLDVCTWLQQYHHHSCLSTPKCPNFSSFIHPPHFALFLLLLTFFSFLPCHGLPLTPSLLRVLRTCGIPLHRHPGLKEALSEMEKQGIISPFLFSTLANMLEGELEEGTADVVGCQEKALTVSVGS